MFVTGVPHNVFLSFPLDPGKPHFHAVNVLERLHVMKKNDMENSLLVLVLGTTNIINI